jgi:polysaccharide export outer membrane protein
MHGSIRKLFSYLIVFVLLCLSLITTSFAADPQPEKSPEKSSSFIYKLGAGDKIRINVFGEENLSGEFEVAPSGSISLALIGSVEAKGLDTNTLEKVIEKKYSDGYLVNPQVSIDVINFRPFFILGEVNKPGSYPYVNGLTVLNAVALSGGYSHRARTDRVFIQRESVSKDKEFEAKDDALVQPGDIIRVTERMF